MESFRPEFLRLQRMLQYAASCAKACVAFERKFDRVSAIKLEML